MAQAVCSNAVVWISEGWNPTTANGTTEASKGVGVALRSMPPAVCDSTVWTIEISIEGAPKAAFGATEWQALPWLTFLMLWQS